MLKNFYQATVQYSSEVFERFMGGLTPSARTVSELLADSSEYGQEVREQVEGRWTKLTSHYIWLASTVIQTGIAALYRTTFARLNYIVECAFAITIDYVSNTS